MDARDERRNERRADAAKHIALMKNAFAAETEAAIASAAIYDDGAALDMPEVAFEKTETDATTAFTVSALFAAKGKVAVVTPVSFTKPGGNYEDGAFGPEQILCSESNLYPILCGLKSEYHDKNRHYQRGGLFTDRALYLSDVVFSRNGDIRKADVIAIPEPNRTRALENHRSERECDQCLESRIAAILSMAAHHGAETLICGTFGCGRQGYDTNQVIALFKAWIEEHPGALGRIVFAVPRNEFTAFDEAFGAPKIEEVVVVKAEEDEDEFDLSSIELPEGITLR